MAVEGSLFHHLTDQFFHMHGYRPGPSEVRAWERSIPALTAALNDAGLGEVEVLLEYALPLNSKRADAVLAGVHPVSGEPSYVVVELKQWGQAEPHGDDPLLCHVSSYARPVLNPIEQVRRYCEYLVNFNGALADHPTRVSGVAYLHNATEFGVSGLREIELDDRGQMFTAEKRGAFLDYLRTKLSDKHSGARAADELQTGRTIPSKQLMAAAALEVREREQFVLLDEQQVAYRMVLNAVHKAKQSDHKEVVVVTGGPGTGKSVIAMSLLGELYRQGVPALHATGSQSFTKTMRKVAGARKREVQDLFKYFNSFMAAEKYGARISAGYCWPWSPEPKPGAALPADVVIGEWARPWNLRGERAISGAPPSALWATDPAGFGQIGCVYTAQGFEYDWSGVIIGPDLVWRGDRWITDRTKSKDPVFRKSTPDRDVDRLIRNTYKVLLTRGMVGTLVYSTDQETQERLRELVGVQQEISKIDH